MDRKRQEAAWVHESPRPPSRTFVSFVNGDSSVRTGSEHALDEFDAASLVVRSTTADGDDDDHLGSSIMGSGSYFDEDATVAPVMDRRPPVISVAVRRHRNPSSDGDTIPKRRRARQISCLVTLSLAVVIIAIVIAVVVLRFVKPVHAVALPSTSAPQAGLRASTSPVQRSASPAPPIVQSIRAISFCGATSSTGRSCSGVGPGGYFYRCCSAHGYCGPKSPGEPQDVYCGAGCQGPFGNCTVGVPVPTLPQAIGDLPVSGNSECGPLVGKRCPAGACCSRSNFCGTQPEHCLLSEYCQPGYGVCT